MAPIKVLLTLIRRRGTIRLLGRSRLKIRKRGASFCQVIRIVAEGHVRAAIVDGNH